LEFLAMSDKPKTSSCPMCKKPAERAGNPSFPFCSSRCRHLDLSKWLDEDYGVTTNITDRSLPSEEEDE